MFGLAVVVYFLFTGDKISSKTSKKDDVNEDCGDETSKMIQTQHHRKDYAAAVEAWRKAKVDPTASVCLPTAVDAMQKARFDAGAITKELREAMEVRADLRESGAINELLEMLVKRRDLDVLDAVLDLLSGLQIEPDSHSYGLLIEAHVLLKNFNEVKSLAARLRKNGAAFTEKMHRGVFTASLRTGQVQDAIACLRTASFDLSSEQVKSFVSLCCKERCTDVLTEFSSVKSQVTSEMIVSLLEDSLKRKDLKQCAQLSELVSAFGVPKTGQVLVLLARGCPMQASALFEAADEVSESAALALLEACAATRDAELAGKVFAALEGRKGGSQLTGVGHSVYAALVKVYMQCEQYEKACDLYDGIVKAGVHLDAQLSGALHTCATQAGRTELAQSLFESAPSDLSKYMAMIRACGKESDLRGALALFQKLRSNGVQLNSLVCNCVLDACVQCGKADAAMAHFQEMRSLEMVDVVSYNTLLKAFLKAGQIQKARALLSEMSAGGVTPNKVTYNEMLNALVNIKDRRGMWQLISDMAAKGMYPNSVTCSIILKSLSATSDPSSVARAMELIDTMHDEMDEVLFSSVIEACVRVGKLDLLSAKLQQYAARGGFEGLTAPTYGSMIKAYGKARDVEKVWELWTMMRQRNVKPTSITLGCMVDALVKNDQPDSAFDLVQEVKQDPVCRDTLNTVIYSTILKGFTLAKQPERVDQVYHEMRDLGIACNTISFNTMIDANCRTGRMERAEQLFADLESTGSPDVVTYSTMVKGYCMSGDIDQGFKVLRKMLASGRCAPDEILFNSLLDGCARQHRVDEALALVEDMHKHHVQPSNYTLSILVKLLGRSRRLQQAFTMVEDTCKRFDFQANIHVYTCLLQACIQNRQLSRALVLHDSMITQAGVQPDSKTYSVLARGCLTSGSTDSLAAIVRCAYGLPSKLVKPDWAPGLEPRVLEEVMSSLSGNPTAERVAVPLLADLKAIGVHVERNTYQRAVKTSVSRAGRSDMHPVQAAFAKRR
jgi:pentatricopeptide repeat protein